MAKARTTRRLPRQSPDGPPLGLRERNKLEKAEVIRQAARKLFTQKGYENTTLREIARVADVGFGTVFSYATDKAGLLAMLYVEDLEHLPPIFEDLTARPILEQLTDAFAKLYLFWARSPALSRIVLPQMEFYNSNPFTEAILVRRAQLKTDLGKWLKRAQEKNRIAPNIDTDDAAAALFAVYTSCLREWITSEPLDVKKGRGRLRTLLAFPVRAIEGK